MAGETSSIFADLDVLLVNSEKFNQLFIQKIKPEWMEQVLSRLSRSPIHFNKFFDILVDFVVSENHPQWGHRALRWLNKIFESPELAAMTRQSQSSLCRFLSFSTGVHGLCQLVDSAVEMIDSASKKLERESKNRHLSILDTGYVFVDDPEVNFGIPRKKSRRSGNNVKEEQDQCGQPALLGDESADSITDEYEEDGEDANYDALSVSEDDGVFDVDNGSTSSLAESQMSTTLPQSQVPVARSTDSDSSDEESKFIGSGEEDDSSSEDDEDEGSQIDVPPQSDVEEEGRDTGVGAAFEGSSSSEASIPAGKNVCQVRRSVRIRNRR